ncbi:MAG: efflux RND transporter periplasmic adaptor subunit [Planctomycetes bacterium]|nr:efflux RND transporter periplasmic adaptor subunit [Planctomycetota bacterium]
MLASCQRAAEPPRPPAAARKAKVAVAEVSVKEVEYTIEAAGSIEAAEEISIPARVSGAADVVNFKEGDVVDEKTVLVEVEVERYRLAAARIEAELQRTEAQAALAETVYANRLKLYEEGRRQRKEWLTEEQMATWRADLDKAKAEVARVKADLAIARRDLEHASVRPPIAGVINTKGVAKGEYVKPETVVATILDVNTLHARFTLPELEAARVRPGQEIQFAVRSMPGMWFRAKLFYLSQKADSATRSIECKAEVLDRHETLRTGIFASVKIVTGRAKAVIVPERAILPTERGFVVFVMEDGKVKRRGVGLGLRTADGVEVTEGLREGERIVVDGAASLRDGMEVDVVSGVP